MVVMVDNFGRFSSGNTMDEGKGLVNHLYEVSTLRVGKPEIVRGHPLRPFTLRSFLAGMHATAATSGTDLVWRFTHLKKSPVIMEISGAQTPAIVIINDTPAFFYPGYTGRPEVHYILHDEPFRRGKNEIRLAAIGTGATGDLSSAVRFYETKSILTEKAEWAFAKWEQPKAISFKNKSASAVKELRGQPAWFRSFFTLSGEPTEEAVWFETTGLSKGLVYVNGHNLGRYFTATADGKSVGPQKRLLVPTSWLKIGEKQKNEIVIFDEHGFSPEKTSIVLHHHAV